MIMKKLLLKISGVAVLVIVVAVAAYVLWPVQPRDVDKTQQGKRSGLQAPADTAPAKPGEERYFEAEKIAVEYPGSAQPGEAKYMPRNRPPLSNGRYSTARRTMPSQYPVAADSETAEMRTEQDKSAHKQEITSEPEKNVEEVDALIAKEIFERVKPELPEGTEIKLTDEQIGQIQQEAMEVILKQYKDNPEQAEELKNILLERLEHYRELRQAASKEKEAPSK